MTPVNDQTGRWWIAGAGTLLQTCLGTVYAWSYLQVPLMDACGWRNTQVAGVFSLAICCLGLAAAWGGVNLAKIGPRKLAVTGGALFGAGYWVAALALKTQSLPLLYLGYGLCGGIGLGLGYVTPVATVAKWFPEKKGLVTGMVIMGFGFGALLMSKVLMPLLTAATAGNLVIIFACLGTIFGVVTVCCGMVLRNPTGNMPQPDAQSGLTARDHLCSAGFLILWCVFFCNIVAGVAIIAFQSPLMQDLLKQANPDAAAASLAGTGATLIAASSVCNGIGRIFWGGVSDRIGRVLAFRIILGTQVLVFLALSRVSQPWAFAALVCYVLLCYGGGFGTMPALITDLFGGRLMAVMYGAVLTAWSAGGIVGPQIVARLKDHFGNQAAPLSFRIGAGLLAAGFVLSLFLKHPRSSA